MHAELHLHTACFNFSLVQSWPTEVVAKALTQSPRQDSDVVLMKLQCSYSVKAILFQCWIEHQVELD